MKGGIGTPTGFVMMSPKKRRKLYMEMSDETRKALKKKATRAAFDPTPRLVKRA